MYFDVNSLNQSNPYEKEFSMKQTIQKIIKISVVAFGVSVCSHAIGQQSKFDFRYTTSDTKFNVFDDGRITRVMMPEGSVIPVITTLKPSGEVLLTPKVDGTTLVLDGIHTGLKLTWANGKTVAVQYQGVDPVRQGQAAAFGVLPPTNQYQAMQPPLRATVNPAAPNMTAQSHPDSRVGMHERHEEKNTPAQAQGSLDEGAAGAIQATSKEASHKPLPAFDLKPPETVRVALQRWATQVGWTFGADFYVLPADIPVVTAAVLGTDFKAAVRALLDSTSMSEVPAQPCFYANQVLRVVPRHELCIRP